MAGAEESLWAADAKRGRLETIRSGPAKHCVTRGAGWNSEPAGKGSGQDLAQVGCGARGNGENSEGTRSFLAGVTEWVTMPKAEVVKGGGGRGAETHDTFG